jgi:ketosteroid isomerase-like protein
LASANERLSRQGLETFSRGELDETLATLHPEVEWHIAFRLPDLPPDMRVARGHDEVKELWRAFRSVWDELTVEVEEILYDVDDMLMARVRFRGRGSGSGVEVDRALFYVLHIGDGLLLRIQPFDTLEEAERAAGL